MSSYLKIQNGTKTKNYYLTNEYEKPYMKVSNSVLPLTTNTTSGMHLKLFKGSQSDTYYMTQANSDGLSSTTALTRESTYDTQYLTRESAYDTAYGYLTASDISAQYNMWGDNKSTSYYNVVFSSKIGSVYTWSMYNGVSVIKTGVHDSQILETRLIETGQTVLTRASTYDTIYYTRTSTSAYSGVSSSSSETAYRPLERKTSSVSTTYYMTQANSDGLSSTTALTRESTYDTQYLTRESTYDTVYGYLTASDLVFFNGVDSATLDNLTYSYSTTLYGALPMLSVHGYAYPDGQLKSTLGVGPAARIDQINPKLIETGQTVLTRASTYDTIYYTRTSTSAYSGVSSSSSEGYTWE